MIQHLTKHEKREVLSTLKFELKRILKESHGERADHKCMSGHNKLINELQITDKNSLDVSMEKDLTIDKLKELVLNFKGKLEYIIMYWNQLSMLHKENFELFPDSETGLNRMFGKAIIIYKGE